MSDTFGSDRSVGALLAARRESLGWEITDIAAALRIKPEYLVALERDDVAALPGAAYAAGFLKSYAEYLGLDGQRVVATFRQRQRGLSEPPELTFPMPLTDRGIPGGNLILITLVLVALGYGSWSWFSSGQRTTVAAVDPVPARLLAPPSLDPPAISPDSAAAAEPRPMDPAVPAATLPPTVTPLPAPAGTVVTPGAAALTQPVAAPTQTAALPVPPPVAANGAHVYGSQAAGAVVIRATGDSWVEVLDGGTSVFQAMLKAGDVYNPPKAGLVMRAGSVGALEVSVNGKTLPPLGKVGDVRKIPLDAQALTTN